MGETTMTNFEKSCALIDCYEQLENALNEYGCDRFLNYSFENPE